jgi:hypothetical protein
VDEREGGGKRRRVGQQANEDKKERRVEAEPKRVLRWMAAPMPSSSGERCLPRSTFHSE